MTSQILRDTLIGMGKQDLETPTRETTNTKNAVNTDNTATKQKMQPHKYISIVIATLIIDASLYAGYKIYYNENTATVIPLIITVFTLIMAPNIIYYGVKYLIKLIIKIVKGGIKKPKIFYPALAGTIIFIAVVFIVVRKTEFTRDQYYLDKIQDQMATAAYIKSVGDNLTASTQFVPSGWDLEKIQSVDNDAQNNLFDMYYAISGTRIEEYYYSTLSWLLDINTGIDDPTLWQDIGANPPEFSISLNDKDLNSAIEKSLTQVMALKQFSELAVLNNDKEAMRFIEARLFVQLHWLENLSYAHDPGIFADSIDLSFSSVQAAESTRQIRECKGFLSCKKLPDNIKRVQGVWQSVHNYTVGEASAESLTDSWENLETGLEDSGIPVTGAGLQVGDDGQTKVSPILEQFSADCHGKGGVVNGTGGVKTNLPTTEDGYTCWTENSNCWDLLTYSGARYKGGARNCEKLGLIPDPTIFQNVEADIDIFTDDLKDSISQIGNGIKDGLTIGTSRNWDGDYNVQFSSAACSGLPNVPGLNTNAYLASFFNTYSMLTVSRNNLAGFSNGYIDANGKTSGTVTVSESGGSGTLRMDLQFSESGQGKAVNGMLYLSVTGPGMNVNCSAKVSGNRV